MPMTQNVKKQQMSFTKTIPMNLQLFADPGQQAQTEPTDNDPGPTPIEPEDKRYTQEDIERIVKERLAFEKKKQEEVAEQARLDAERKYLAEQEKYKELADNYKSELDELKAQVIDVKKEALLAKAGYNAEQVERYRKYVVGETDEELAKSVNELVEDIPPKKPYVDPGAGNGGKDKPKPKDLTEKGKSAYKRLKEKGKIKRKK